MCLDFAGQPGEKSGYEIHPVFAGLGCRTPGEQCELSTTHLVTSMRWRPRAVHDFAPSMQFASPFGAWDRNQCAHEGTVSGFL